MPDRILLIAACGVAGIGLVLFAILHIRAANVVRRYLGAEYPAIDWSAPGVFPLRRQRGPASQRLTVKIGGRVLLDVDDPEYLDLASRAQLWMGLWMASLFGLVFALGFLTTPR